MSLRSRTVALGAIVSVLSFANLPAVALAASGGCTQPVGASHSPLGAGWAAAFAARAYIHPHGELTSDPTTAHDAFPRPLAIAGLHLDSGGTGSCAVYDRAHGIAATTQGGEVTGSSIGLAPPPPVPDVPDADLSHVRSERGLHLGMSIAELQRVFGTAHHVRFSADRKRSYYYYRRTQKSAANDALFIFTAGKATYISLVEVAV